MEQMFNFQNGKVAYIQFQNLVQLIGPVKRLACFSSTPRTKREITSQPRAGEFVTVETPTSLRGVLEFVNGATVTLNTSWDVHKHGLSPIELYGENHP